MKKHANYLGALIGDINGSKYEFNNIHTKEFDLFQDGMHMTDDSLLTLAVMKSLVLSGNPDAGDEEFASRYQMNLTKEFVRKYCEFRRGAGFGGRFSWWAECNLQEPYNSFGNGSAMRVSPVAYVSKSLEECMWLAELTASVTHNHPEGIKGSQATVVAVFLALHGHSKEEIKRHIATHFYPELNNMSYNSIKENFKFDETCQGTVPQAVTVFLESENFEDCIRSAVALGGDCDTVAAIACSIASAYYDPEMCDVTTINRFLLKEDVDIISQFNEFIKTRLEEE